MQNQKDDTVQQKEAFLSFTFEQQNDQLLIKAQSGMASYCAFLEPSPLLPFDKIKKALSTKNYELVSINHEQMQITVGAVLDILLTSQHQLTLDFLKETILKMTAKLQDQTQKNTQLESLVSDIQNDIAQIKNQQENQRNLQNQKMTRIESKLQALGEQNSQNASNQNKLIAIIQQEIFELKEGISKPKECTKSDFIAHEGTKDREDKVLSETIELMKKQVAKNRENNDLISNKLEALRQEHSRSITQLRQFFEDHKKQQQQINRQYSQKADQQAKDLSTKFQMIEQLKNEFSQLKNQNQQDKFVQEITQQIIDLTGELNLLRTQFDKIFIQTLPKSLNYDENCDFQDSKVVCTLEEKYNMRKFFTKAIKQVKLLYRASEPGFCVEKFHQICDGIPNTLTVIRTEFDKKIGGFSVPKWSSSKQKEYAGDNSKESFIFSLSYNDKFTLYQSECAIYNHHSHGPSFGGRKGSMPGSQKDLSIFFNYNSTSYGRASICQSYSNEKYKYGEKASLERFNGDTNGQYGFVIKEWEVWAVEWP